MKAPYDDPATKNKIRGALRRAFSSSPFLSEIKNKQRVEKAAYNKDGSVAKKPDVWYKCEYCGQLAKGAKNKKGLPYVQVDHTDPVIRIDRELHSWDEFIERLYCSFDNLKVICSDCHKKKTKHERDVRKNPALEAKRNYYKTWSR